MPPIFLNSLVCVSLKKHFLFEIRKTNTREPATSCEMNDLFQNAPPLVEAVRHSSNRLFVMQSRNKNVFSVITTPN